MKMQWKILKFISIKITAIIFGIYASPVFADELASFSEFELGIDNISYQENLDDLAGKGKLQQSVHVTNPVIRNSSYTALNDKWGLRLRAQSTMATGIQTERWRLGNYGVIQEDEFKVKYADIGLAADYQWNEKIHLYSGCRFSASGFTRSNFSKKDPGASQFEQDIAPAKFTAYAGAINEDQYTLLAEAGVHYQSARTNPGPWDYSLDMALSTPLVSITQNTSIPDKSLQSYFNGWGVTASASMGYKLGKTLKLKLSANLQHYNRNEIVEYQQKMRLRVPDIEVTSVGLSAGLAWAY